MPARHFWGMYRAYKKLDARNKMELCDIQAISICNAKYYKTVHGRFLSTFNFYCDEEEVIHKKKFSPYPVIKSESLEAHHTLMRLFHEKKRSG